MVRITMTSIASILDDLSPLALQSPHPAIVKRQLNIEASRKRKRTSKGSSRRPKARKTHAFPFMSLPLELRLKIYDAYFQFGGSSVCNTDCQVPCNYHEYESSYILYVSKQVYSEVWPVYARYRCFAFRQLSVLTEDFLCILSPPNLHRITHLTIHNGLSFGHQRFMDGLKQIWWKYIEVFTRLESFTFEAVTHESWRPTRIPHFYKLVPVLLQLLEQGAPMKSELADSEDNNLSTAHSSLDLPKPHQWALHVGGIQLNLIDGCLASSVIAYHKIIIQRHSPWFSQPPELLRGRIKQIEQELQTQKEHREFYMAIVQRCYLSVIDRASCQYGISMLFSNECRLFAKFTLGDGSCLLNKLTGPTQFPGHYPTEMVTITGQFDSAPDNA